MIHLIEALLYQKLDEEKVRCYVCHHHCVIKSGQRGICGVRENREGVLFALNYGKTIAMQIDPIEKKPIYHFLSWDLVIFTSNSWVVIFHCLWCQNNEISQIDESNKQIRGKNITPETHVNMAIKNNCQSISYTYSEPTIFSRVCFGYYEISKKKRT